MRLPEGDQLRSLSGPISLTSSYRDRKPTSYPQTVEAEPEDRTYATRRPFGALAASETSVAMTSSAPSTDSRWSAPPVSMYTYPRPAASAAAHTALNGSCVEATLGVNADQLSASPWMRRVDPSGDQLNECTDGPPKTRRGKPDSLTIHTPPDEPSARAVANATQWRKGRDAPVVNTKLWFRYS